MTRTNDEHKYKMQHFLYKKNLISLTSFRTAILLFSNIRNFPQQQQKMYLFKTEKK